MDYKLFLDTNALLNLQERAFEEYFVISQVTLQEIENIKTSSTKDGDVKYKARCVSRLLDKNYGNYKTVRSTEEIKNICTEHGVECSPDNIIAASAYLENEDSPTLLVTDDLNLKFIAREIFNLRVKSVNDIHIVTDVNSYVGYKDVTMNEEEMSSFYSNLKTNMFNNLVNEYLIIRNADGDVVDYRRWNGEEYDELHVHNISSNFLGNIKPANPQQVIAFDMLQDPKRTIKVISGKQGTGKDFVMVSNAIRLIEKRRFLQLIYVRNPIGVQGIEKIGYLPGEAYDKLLPYSMPLADHLGGITGLQMQEDAGHVKIEYLGNIRGRDFKNSIIMCSESENLTKEHVQLLIGRVGENSELWLNGDYNQSDSPIFHTNSGLMSAITKLAGNEKFSYVRLEDVERSETSALAELLD